MRKFLCDEKACTLEPSHQNQSGSGCVKTYNEMSGGSAGLDPVASTFYIPLKQASSSGGTSSGGPLKRKKRSQTGRGPMRKVKRKVTKKKKTHSRGKAPRRRIKQFGAGQKKRKCVKRKRK